MTAVKKSVIQFDVNWNKIIELNPKSEASRTAKINDSSINECCRYYTASDDNESVKVKYKKTAPLA